MYLERLERVLTFVDYLQTNVPARVAGFSGTAGLYIQQAGSNQTFAYNAQKSFPTASVIKVFILSALLSKVDSGDLQLDKRMTLTESNQVGGSGLFKDFDLGASFTLKDAAMAMMVISDNTATNICVDAVGGVDEVNSHIRGAALDVTRLGGRIELEGLSSDPASLGVTTPQESVDFLKRLLNGEILSENSTKLAEHILSRQQVADQFPRFLPYSIYAGDLGFDQSIYLAHKTGYVPSVRADIGYIKIFDQAFFFAVLSSDCVDNSMHFENEGTLFAGHIGKLLYEAVCVTKSV